MENVQMTAALPTKAFWQGKKVLVTGHTGFKGSWLSLWLSRLGAQVIGVSLPVVSSPSLFHALKLDNSQDNHYIDLRNSEKLRDCVVKFQPEIVLHLAAQAIVTEGYKTPLDTFSTNVMGTANLLEALRYVSSTKVAVMVTTDKVYQNNEWHYPYRETDTLGGHDPYSSSKAASEHVISCYRDAFLSERGVAVASARAGNVIAGGDWAENRLIPDAIRAWEGNNILNIRNPNSTRPWQHVLEPLAGYLVLAEKLWQTPELSGAFNFGPNPSEATSVGNVITLAQKAYGKGESALNDERSTNHEAKLLALETSKSAELLSIKPKWATEEAVYRTMNWYRRFNLEEEAIQLCNEDINAYESL